VERTWKPTVAGILDIVIGTPSFALSLLLLFAGFSCMTTYYQRWVPELILGPMAATIASLLAIIGGIYALKRKK
jgi:hypothetical protein